jgi:hypothetical protein
LSPNENSSGKKRKTSEGETMQEPCQQEFSSQEELGAYLEKVYKMQPTIWAINQAFPRQGKAGSAYWVIARYLVPRDSKQIRISL